MTRFLLIRHGLSEANIEGILAGQKIDSPLTSRGHQQARQLSKSLSELKITTLVSSPMLRCRQTLEPLRILLGKRIHLDESFVEMDYGLWSGMRLKKLRQEQLWKTIQKQPSKVTFPEGESFQSAQRRVSRGMRQLSQRYPNGTVIIASHGDIIKMALSWALSSPLDEFQRIIIDPSSISTVTVQPNHIAVEGINHVVGKESLLGRVNAKKTKLSNRRILGGGAGV